MNAQFQALMADVTAGGIDSFTKIMLHMDGADNGTVFTDSSLSPNTVNQFNGAVTHTTSFAAPKFGTASGKFPGGTNDRIEIPDAAALRPGTGDFTIDFWVRYNGTTAGTLFDKGFTNANGFLIQSDTSASPKLKIWLNGTNILTETTGTATGGAFTHKAIVRASGVITIYSGGLANGSVSGAATITHTAAIGIGNNAGGGGGAPLNANVDEWRYSVGIARWTSAFNTALPSGPYTT